MKKHYFFFLIVMVLIYCLTGCAGNDKASYTYGQEKSQYSFKQIRMCSESTGWAVTRDNEVLFTDSGVGNFAVVKKFDNINKASDSFLNGVFADERTAYVTYFSEDTSNLIVEYTNNRGEDWSRTYVDYSKYAEICDAGSAYISFADSENGYLLYCSTPAAGMMTKLLFSTMDGGKNFSFVCDLTNEIKGGYPQGITFSDRDKGYMAVSYHGLENAYLYTTSDGGRTWKSEKVVQQDKESGYIDAVRPPEFYGENKQKGILLLKFKGENEEYGLFCTDDGGNNWTQKGNISIESVVDYTIASEKQLFITDSAGSLHKVSGDILE